MKSRKESERGGARQGRGQGKQIRIWKENSQGNLGIQNRKEKQGENTGGEKGGKQEEKA